MNNIALSKSKFFLFFTIILSVAFFNTAWIAEDAFITFRAVDNLLNGNGPVWNINERVQVYTHPTWYFLLSLGTAIFTYSYWVALGLSYICLLTVIFLFMRISNHNNYSAITANTILVLLTLPLSRAFMDYSSSGLENPLLHALLLSYVIVFISNKLSIQKKYALTSFIYGLIFLTRPDAIFLVTPCSLYLFSQMVTLKKRWLVLSILSILPVIFWELFSLIYYGSFVPNTALAKVNIDFERATLIKNAYHYFIFNIKNDPITTFIILLGISLPWLSKRGICRLFSLGIILQLSYMTYVGADYMLGRFMSPSFILSIVSLICLPNTYLNKQKNYNYSGIALLIFMIPFQLPYTLKYAGNYTNIKISEHGIADERGFYFQHLGMLPVLIKHKGNYTTFPWVSLGYQAQDKNNINIFCAIGMTGWASGSKPYWVDPYALAEPFLARLPAKLDSRTGHYERAFPSGYFKTLISKESHFANETIARLYKDIRLTVAGDIWTKKRWEAIYRLNTGHYQHLEKHFDRNATGLMELGFAVHDRGSRSCAGFKNLHKFISIPPTNNK